MRAIATVAATLLLGLSMAGGPSPGADGRGRLGVWLNPENQSNVEFYRCGEGLCGKITKVSDGQKTDDKNPDAAKRNRPIVGLVIMEGAKKTGANKWSGTLYNRADGKSYSGTVTVKAKNTLDLSGCVALVVCRTTTWTRVK